MSRFDHWEHHTEWPLAAAAVVFLVAYASEVIGDLEGIDLVVCEWTMNAVWAIFTIDYAVRLVLAPDRRSWFWRHLLDLAAVVLPVLRPLRLLRLVVLFGVLQQSAGSALHGRITAYTVASVSLLVFVGALAILDAERGVDGASIHSFENALWWTIVTITTAGYGDLSPVTPMDRFVAVLLMIGGVALIGVVTATLASWVVGLVAEETAKQEAATRAQVAELQAQIAGIEGMRLQALTARSQGQVQSGHELLATTGTLTPETAPERSPETSTG